MRQITRKGANREDITTMFLKKYKPNPDSVEGMEEDVDGQWVRYEVMEHVVQVLEEELRELRKLTDSKNDENNKEVQS